jgi:hypothetical protein
MWMMHLLVADRVFRAEQDVVATRIFHSLKGNWQDAKKASRPFAVTIPVFGPDT